MRRVLIAIGIMVAAAGCTLENQGAPPMMSAPSALGMVVTLSASPTVLPQDGVSQSTIELQATSMDGQPLANHSFFTEGYFIFRVVKQAPPATQHCPTGAVDLGEDEENAALAVCQGFLGRVGSATITTGADGKAFTVVTAPSPVVAASEVIGTVRVTPLGSSFGDGPSFVRVVHIKLTGS